MTKQYFVYIMSNQRNTTLYVGFTSGLLSRNWQHKNKVGLKSFTKKYNVDKLVYFEIYDDPNDAIYREKQIKGWIRKKKENLINSINPEWKDLSDNL
ncbi:MAG: GIY-YIG nuclease family protein [Patescibacteria group bacterium]|nr:GIY-YIG nuclease family protein [Patescibacteria group bacterium]